MTLAKLLSNKSLRTVAITLPLFFMAPIANAQNAAAIDEMTGYMDFIEYGGGVIFAEQIPKEEYENIMVIDARDADQLAPGTERAREPSHRQNGIDLLQHGQLVGSGWICASRSWSRERAHFARWV